MTTSFPTDKTQPFVAENGVTYYWDSDRWRVKTYKKEDDTRLPYRLGTDKAARSARSGEPAIELVDAEDNYSNVKFFGVNGIECESTISGIKIDGSALLGGEVDLTGYATIDYSDTEDEKLQNQIDELGVTKGKVARYTCSSITGGFASRPGQLAFNSGDPTAVNQISFGTEDSDNVLTKPMADGDIIEFVDAVSNTVSRFKITDASGAPTGVEVEYVSGNNDFNVGEEEQVYIYPQNTSGASKDYVDAQDALNLPLTGGTITGTFTVEGTHKGKLIKSIRNTGYAFEVKPDDVDTKAFIHTDGKAEFSNKVTIKKTDTKSHQGFTIKGTTSSGSESNLLQAYHNADPLPDAVNYNGKIEDGANLVNKQYVDDQVSSFSGGSNPHPGRLFTYLTGSPSLPGDYDPMTPGGFLSGGSGATPPARYLHISYIDANGNKWGNKIGDGSRVVDTYFPISIYEILDDGSHNIILQSFVTTTAWYTTGLNVYVNRTGLKENEPYELGKSYYINIPGFL